MHPRVDIGPFTLGHGAPCLVVAEAGVNHNGDLSQALTLIDAAVEAGADAIKFQSFVTEELVTDRADKAAYQTANTASGGGQYAMLKALELSFAQQAKVKQHCERQGILYLCTPYERQSIDMLDSLDVAAYKIASTDTTNLPMLRAIAAKRRPVILSTGMCTLAEIEAAVTTLEGHGLAGNIVLLQCTAEYPAPCADINLRAMATLERAFGCPTGFSDHTEGIGASPWAVALGACMIEKHFTLDRTLPGPDHRASIEPDELALLVRTVRQVEAALGDGIKVITPSERGNKEKMQKSLVASRTIQRGQVIGAEDLTCKRPGDGLPPLWEEQIVGRTAARTIGRDQQLTIDDVVWQR